MFALRTLGILILTLMAVTIGIFGFLFILSASEETTAKDAAAKVTHACQLVISAGGMQVVEIYLPRNFTMRFQENYISVDGYSVPEEGLSLEFAEDVVIGPGHHTVSVTENGGKLVISWT